MQGKIALEEHFALEETTGNSEQYAMVGSWNDLRRRLLDFHDQRLASMDKCGIEMSVLSLNAPAIQAIPNVAQAVEIARRANDLLAEEVAKRPDRFAGLAALPMQSPDEAARELSRCVKDLGLKGALVNGFSEAGSSDTVIYYDLARYLPFWATVEELGVPFYLHPRDPVPSRSQMYEGHPWFVGSAWAFGVETAIHALRLMGSGLFDRHPRLQIILGHLGERIPFDVWRTDHRLGKSPRGIPAKKKMAEYLRSNFHITTSGNFRDQTLLSAMLEVGADRLLFSVDYPFEENEEAAQWFDSVPVSETDRIKIGRTNAIKLLKLPLA
ncbi:gamma-resorcylate decarboxylase [Rhizobiales bacterium GAS191]|nr:gamma-resorcylate decarboxylase [Rhizobiales bacterium GAS191]